MRTVVRWLLVLPALPLVSGTAIAAIYKCTDAAGKVAYQAQPCPAANVTRAMPVDAAPMVRPPVASPPATTQRPPQNKSWQAPADDEDTPAAVRPTERPALPEVPRIRLNFDLLSIRGTRLPWTNTGPRDSQRNDGAVRSDMAEPTTAPAAVNGNGTEAYTLDGNGGTLTWLPKGFGGPAQELHPPGNLPRLSWASGLAWDTRGGVLAIVSNGGQGFFYRYDTRRHIWLDAHSLQDRDLLSLAFDTETGTYVGISQQAELLTFNADGTVAQIQPLADLLVGLRGAFNPGAPRASSLTLAAHGGVVAIVGIRNASVTHIWTYEQRSNRAQLTYKAPL